MTEHFKSDTRGMEVAEMFPERLKHKTFILAGLVRGELAATVADVLSHGGAGCIIFTGGSQSALQSTLTHIHRKHPKTKILFITADTNDLASMREAANTIKALDVPIDGIICFQTVMAATWETTVNGIESHFQKNYLGYFVLVNLLLETLSQGSRVVLMTTSIRREAAAPKWEDVNFSTGETYHCLDGYAQSMFANIQFAKSLASRCLDRSISSFSVNPGNTKTNVQTYVTPEVVESWLQCKKDVGEELPILLQQAPKSQSQASASVLRGLLDPTLEEKSGAFLDNCQVLPLPHLDFPAGTESAAALWKLSEELVDRAGLGQLV
ncbi:hypothetical protein N7462_011538 [Penicillium macrosclerotiorum]|uniref:uncharacterized protein n=1 Tax=Penicillium macrosclerotiorum TaxID=303699 RepID=UPI00254671D0|nr:uncharacterized protein N7462_011538 [Penicillium macrosclerotiorum]KAJ5664725.1 hypothetical protein N7462_011538 [Penicillium macrosclerotiorum]